MLAWTGILINKRQFSAEQQTCADYFIAKRFAMCRTPLERENAGERDSGKRRGSLWNWTMRRFFSTAHCENLDRRTICPIVRFVNAESFLAGRLIWALLKNGAQKSGASKAAAMWPRRCDQGSDQRCTASGDQYRKCQSTEISNWSRPKALGDNPPAFWWS